MKFMKGLTVGILIGILLTGSAFAAVQYNLSESEWKVVVDGQVVQDERYPVLLLDPGYNYMAVGSLRAVCEKAGIPFEADVSTKEVRITTTKEEVKTVSTKNITPTAAPVEYFEPYTIERDGVKKVFIGDINKLLKSEGYEISDSHKSDGLLWLRCNGAPVIKDIHFSMHSHPDYKEGVGYIDYEFYIESIEPLIKK